jgi:hypothetical protein
VDATEDCQKELTRCDLFAMGQTIVFALPQQVMDEIVRNYEQYFKTRNSSTGANRDPRRGAWRNVGIVLSVCHTGLIAIPIARRDLREWAQDFSIAGKVLYGRIGLSSSSTAFFTLGRDSIRRLWS